MTYTYFVVLGGITPQNERLTVGEIVSLSSATEALERGMDAIGRPYAAIEGTEDREASPDAIITGFTIERYDGEETDGNWFVNGGMRTLPKKISLETQVTAAEFLAWVTPEVEVEAGFTEDNNEDRTLHDYLADLHTRIERFMSRDLTVY